MSGALRCGVASRGLCGLPELGGLSIVEVAVIVAGAGLPVVALVFGAVGGGVAVGAGWRAWGLAAGGCSRFGERHVHGFLEAEVAATGDACVELAGELVAQGCYFVLLMPQLLLQHGDLGSGGFWAPWWRVHALAVLRVPWRRVGALAEVGSTGSTLWVWGRLTASFRASG
ncbi:MAG TPA: hypothetical protein VGH54_28885 [Mycobacterium sp.]|uniref:hypothetical protein n=1 Tax=Mycobacterium sp. TaxID=1785 RepID=UPI002F3F78C0